MQGKEKKRLHKKRIMFKRSKKGRMLFDCIDNCKGNWNSFCVQISLQ